MRFNKIPKSTMRGFKKSKKHPKVNIITVQSGSGAQREARGDKSEESERGKRPS